MVQGRSLQKVGRAFSVAVEGPGARLHQVRREGFENELAGVARPSTRRRAAVFAVDVVAMLVRVANESLDGVALRAPPHRADAQARTTAQGVFLLQFEDHGEATALNDL